MTHPILFQPAMVRAIIHFTKTQTRREVTERNSVCTEAFKNLDFDNVAVEHFFEPHYLKVLCPADRTRHRIFCKYEIGDVLWVREKVADLNGDFKGVPSYYVYIADLLHPDQHGPVTWKPSIHMPKAACRLWLQVTEVRVQRLNDIEDADAREEGVELVGSNVYDGKLYRNYTHPKLNEFRPKFSFLSLWESINGTESLQANPWVWAISFKPCEMPQDFLTEKK